MWSKLAGPSSPNLAVNATCTSGQLFGSSAVAYSFGQMLDVRNVVLQKCAWNAAHNKCMDSVGLAHEDARQVAKLRSLITSCETTWFPQTGQHRTVPTGHHGNAVKAVQLSQAAAAAESPDEIAFLIDAFGMTVIGHANLDVLFPLATTVRALFRSESFLDCKQRGGQCRVFLVNGAEQSNSPNGRHHSAVSSYNREMQTLILGRPFERADAIPLRRYARVVVGFLSEAQPVMWPHIYLNHITHRPNQHRLWNDFHATLRAELGLLRAIGSYGVWLRREPSAARDLGARRNLNDGEWATVQAHACASSVDGGARRSRGDSSGGAKAMGALGGSDCWLHELHLHKLAFHEQARAMQGARLIGSFEGSSFVNQLFMPPGGTLLMIDTQKRGTTSFMWGYGQYLHPELIFGVLAPPSKGDFSIAQMAHVGGLLRHAWEGGVGRACRLLDEGSPVGMVVHTRPDCEHYGHRKGPPLDDSIKTIFGIGLPPPHRAGPGRRV